VFLGLARSANPDERAWALVGLAQIARFHDRDTTSTQADLKEALELVPDHPLALSVACTRGMQTEHEEEALAGCHATSKKLSGREPGLSPRLAIAYKFNAEANLALLTGDFDAVRKVSKTAAEYFGAKSIGAEDSNENLFVSFAAQHDRRAMQETLKSIPAIATLDPQSRADRLWSIFYADALLGDWRSVVQSATAVEQAERTSYPGSDNDTLIAAQNAPWIALAKAELGDVAGAKFLIGKTSPECIACLRVRGDVAAIEKRWEGAAYWFADAAKRAPSIPSVFADWGAMLMAKGDYDTAIEKFRTANQKGPHFADPLEMWGEALIAKNRSDLALTTFAEANKYAPKWGRLHLKWGETLLWSGDKDGAQTQFATASHLDLSAADKAALTRVSAMHG
jgi:tetratricopeptide (TPR) repeat protein